MLRSPPWNWVKAIPVSRVTGHPQVKTEARGRFFLDLDVSLNENTNPYIYNILQAIHSLAAFPNS
ncbi:hypothetical protein KIN_08660 [Litoreibacter roseus]|uniref:Uncharacterized protein n=1 Tax=Litoreibacter roseus TaxID=2601869 RepID=A0A6N6JF04_9RHOB|nr:hypothetical protein KIN_08660 [Litoreibacter roseus]